MFILGLQGSPRIKGNTSFLLSAFMQEAEKIGAATRIIHVDKSNIMPCKEYVLCEKKGVCPIDDDMKHDIYGLLRRADLVVAATPVFFYNMSAQLKSLVDRCQTLWARKYRLKLKDPGAGMRRGYVLSVAATHGKNLFDGIELTAKYFFDALDARYEGSLTYRGIENSKDMAAHPTVLADVRSSVQKLLEPFNGRKRVLFACRENACRSQMAGGLTGSMAADRIEVLTGGSAPAHDTNPLMVQAMAEKGIDMAFRSPQSIEAALAEGTPDVIITMGCGEKCPHVPGAQRLDWDLPDPAGGSIGVMRQVRDEIEKKVVKFINGI